MLFVDVDDDFFDRLFQLACFVTAKQHPRPRHRQLVAFAAHGLDQDAELQFSAAGDFHGVLVVALAHAQRNVAFGFAQQAVTDHTAGDLAALGAGKGRVVDTEGHRQRRRIDRLRRHRSLDRRIANGMGDGRVRQAGQGDDIAGFRLVDGDTLQTAERQHLGDAAVLDQIALAVEHLHRLVRLHAARPNAPGDDAAEIIVGFDDGAEQTERAFLDHRRLYVAEHQLEQGLHAVVLRAFQRGRHPPLLGRAVEDRKVELLVGGVERGEQVEHFVDHLDGAGVGAVDLVDHDDGFEAHLQRLRHHEFGLRQRTLSGVDQHQGAVHHVEDAFDLAAEVGVAGGVDDVDARALPIDRGSLGQDGDAALALEIVRVHGAVDLALVLAVDPRLLQQAVDQRGLAVVDVGDDGDVAKVHFMLSPAPCCWSGLGGGLRPAD